MAVALERQDVRRQPIEEEAIVADDHRAAGEGFQGFLKRPQRLDVEIVGRLVEQEDVAALLEHLGHVDTVAFAARQLADLFLLVLPAEIERADISTRAHFLFAEAKDLQFVGDFLPDIFRGIEVIAALVDITELDGRADVDLALVGLFLPGNQLEQGRLAGAVRPNHADDAAGGQREV